MEYRWSAKPLPDEQKVLQLSKAINVNKQIATILVQRGIETYEQAETFFRPSLKQLHDPFSMKDMDKAIARIQKAIADREKILVYGDYDVDGTTAVSIVYSFFLSFNPDMDYYIPDRYKEGYGISKIGIDYAAEQGFSLIIALDCGIRANDLVDYAKTLGIDVIICDHHLPGDKIPHAAAILNPKQLDCPYPYKELSGAGIGYKLIQGYAKQEGLDQTMLEEYLDLVAVSIASDIVDIRGENRILAYFGLKKLNEDPTIGLQSLLEGSGMQDRKYTFTDIVFGIGPRINAAGRISDAKAAVKVLIERDNTKARQLAKVLQDHNIERKELDSDITKEAIHLIDHNEYYLSRKSTVLKGNHWHKGVIGIVASRLVETYYKPTIVFSENNGMLTGSARSVKDFDIHEAIGACGDLVEQFGGHKYAAGLSIKYENFDAFAERFEEIVRQTISPHSETPVVEYDLTLDFPSINTKMMDLLQQMAPFGPGNMFPIFRSNHISAKNTTRVLKDKHLKLTMYQGGQSFDAIGFGMSHYLPVVSGNQIFDACYSIEENDFRGRKSIQLRIKDLKETEG